MIDCHFEPHGDAWICRRCARPSNRLVRRNCRRPGVGTILKGMLAQLGFDESMGCDCKSTIAWMNAMGPAGCRAHVGEAVTRLERSRKLVGWVELARAGAIALANGLPLTLKGLVLEACDRAEST